MDIKHRERQNLLQHGISLKDTPQEISYFLEVSY